MAELHPHIITDFTPYGFLPDRTEDEVGNLVMALTRHVNAGGDIPPGVLSWVIDYLRKDRAKSPSGEEATKAAKKEKRAASSSPKLSVTGKEAIFTELFGEGGI